MNTRNLLWLMFAAAMLLPISGTGQEPPKSPTPEEMAKYRELAKPGPEHDLLAKFAGEWNVTLTAGSRPESFGSGRSYMTLERRFLWIGYQAKGKSGVFKGAFTLGFDRRNERFMLIAMDTDGTYFVTSQGKKLPDSETLKLYGKDDDPYMAKLGFEKEFAHAVDLSDPDKFTIEVLYIDTRTEERKELRAMVFTFARKKEAE